MTTPRRRLSFSLRTLFVVVTVLGVVPAAVISLCRNRPLESKHNMMHLCFAAMTYKERHGDWPDSLDDVTPLIGNPGFRADMGILGNGKSFEALMKNPITGDNPGYKYVNPKKNAFNPMIYQLRNGKADPNDPDLSFADTRGMVWYPACHYEDRPPIQRDGAN